MIDVLRRPRWIVGTVICVALVLLFVRLGFWQLDRLHERRAQNERIESRMELPVEPVEVVGDEEYRRVAVDGAWDDAATVFVRSRSYQGRPGFHVLTPVVVGEEAVIVNRGWVPEASAPPVSGRAHLEGLTRRSQQRGSIGPRDPEDGVLREIVRADLGRIQQQYDRPLLPVYVEVEGEPGAAPPFPIEPPDLADGPHLSYAGQWFLFALIGAGGWVILLRRQAA
jgi:surfeit locus 1 family protein